MRMHPGCIAPWRTVCWLAIGATVMSCLGEPPRVVPEPASLKFVSTPGENPPGQALKVFNFDNTRGPLEASSQARWLHLQASATPEIFRLISVDVTELAEGTYTTTIQLFDPFGILVATVPVTLTISQDVYIEQGVIYSNFSVPVPRRILLLFVEGTPQAEIIAVIDSFGASLLYQSFYTPEFVVVKIPIGRSLREAVAYFDADPAVAIAMLNWGGPGVFAGFYRLESQNGVDWLFHDDLDYLENFAREGIVEVRGIVTWENVEYVGSSSVEVYSVRKLALNEFTLHGTIRLEGVSAPYLLLIDDAGRVWELLGQTAETIAALSDIDGAGITVTGLYKGVSMDAHSGGLQLQVNAFTLD